MLEFVLVLVVVIDVEVVIAAAAAAVVVVVAKVVSEAAINHRYSIPRCCAMLHYTRLLWTFWTV